MAAVEHAAHQIAHTPVVIRIHTGEFRVVLHALNAHDRRIFLRQLVHERFAFRHIPQQKAVEHLAAAESQILLFRQKTRRDRNQRAVNSPFGEGALNSADHLGKIVVDRIMPAQAVFRDQQRRQIAPVAEHPDRIDVGHVLEPVAHLPDPGTLLFGNRMGQLRRQRARNRRRRDPQHPGDPADVDPFFVFHTAHTSNA